MAPEEEPELTTLHVQRARRGEPASVSWLVERFSPLLLAQARYRMGERLRARCEARELVQEVWARALPALATLQPSGERATPTLVAFLARTLLLRVRELLREAARAPELASRPLEPRAREPEPDAGLEHAERVDAVRAAVEALSEADREAFVLRAVEQLSNEEAARLCGVSPNALSLRYNRVLGKLRESLPDSVFAEL